MNDTRNAGERLEALLTGLEDEVMRGEGCVDTDVAGMRAEIEALVKKHGDVAVDVETGTPGVGGVKDKVIGVVELLGRWAGIGQSGARGAAVPRVRMAFSGEREAERRNRAEREGERGGDANEGGDAQPTRRKAPRKPGDVL